MKHIIKKDYSYSRFKYRFQIDFSLLYFYDNYTIEYWNQFI